MALLQFYWQLCKGKSQAKLGAWWNFLLFGRWSLSHGHVSLIKKKKKKAWNQIQASRIILEALFSHRWENRIKHVVDTAMWCTLSIRQGCFSRSRGWACLTQSAHWDQRRWNLRTRWQAANQAFPSKVPLKLQAIK